MCNKMWILESKRFYQITSNSQGAPEVGEWLKFPFLVCVSTFCVL